MRTNVNQCAHSIIDSAQSSGLVVVLSIWINLSVNGLKGALLASNQEVVGSNPTGREFSTDKEQWLSRREPFLFWGRQKASVTCR